MTEPTSDFAELRDRVASLEAGLAENTASTNQIKGDIAEILDLFRLSKGGFRVLGNIGSMLKWVTGIAAAVTTIWYTVKGGK